MKTKRLKNGQKWSALFEIEMTQNGEVIMKKAIINPSKRLKQNEKRNKNMLYEKRWQTS